MEAVAGFPKREVQAISLIGFAHMLSHLYWIAFAPLAPSMMGFFGISAFEWGLSLGIYSVMTGQSLPNKFQACLLYTSPSPRD